MNTMVRTKLGYNIIHRNNPLLLSIGSVAVVRSNRAIQNNSHIVLEDVGPFLTTALICLTNKSPCCNSEDGSWYHPDGSRVLAASEKVSDNFYQSTFLTQTVILYRPIFADNFPSGIFHCEINDTSNTRRKLYIGIYRNGEGNTDAIKIF